MRRRLRQQLRVREALLLDLGALVYELHRQGKRAPELLQRKAAELTVVDDEVRELEARLSGSPVATGRAATRPAVDTTEVDSLREGEDEAPEADELAREELAADEEALHDSEEDALDEDEEVGEDEFDADDELAGDEAFDEDETQDHPALAEHEERRP